MNQLEDTARDIGARARDTAVERTADAIADAVPEARVSTEPGRVVVESRGRARRRAIGSVLRLIGRLLR